MRIRYVCLAVALSGCGRGEADRPPADGTGALPPAVAIRADDAGDKRTPVVITQADDDAIRKLLDEFRAHATSNAVVGSSDTRDYLDCPAHRELLGYGWKAVPYLVEEAGRLTSADAYLGSALINDPAVKTPEQVVAYNRARHEKALATLLPPHVVIAVLQEITAGGEIAGTGKPVSPPWDGDGGVAFTDLFAWVDWWQTHKARFEFRTERPVEIPLPEPGGYDSPQVIGSARGHLLDIHAVGVTCREVIERAAAELGVHVVIGKLDGLDRFTTVRMKSVTFEEFLLLLGDEFEPARLPYRKAGAGYRIGAE